MCTLLLSPGRASFWWRSGFNVPTVINVGRQENIRDNVRLSLIILEERSGEHLMLCLLSRNRYVVCSALTCDPFPLYLVEFSAVPGRAVSKPAALSA